MVSTSSTQRLDVVHHVTRTAALGLSGTRARGADARRLPVALDRGRSYRRLGTTRATARRVPGSAYGLGASLKREHRTLPRSTDTRTLPRSMKQPGLTTRLNA